MIDKEKLKESQIKLQLLYEQIKEVEKQTQLLNNQRVDLTMSVQYLDEFTKLKPGTEILVPVNQGVYAKAELKDTKELIVNVGSNVTVNKDVEATKKLINDQLSEITNIQEKIALNLQNLVMQANQAEKEMNEISLKNV